MYIFVSNIVNNCVTRTIFPMYRNGKWFSLLWCLYVTTIGCVCAVSLFASYSIYLFIYIPETTKKGKVYLAGMLLSEQMWFGYGLWGENMKMSVSFVSAAMCSNKYGKRNEKHNPKQSTTTTIDEEKDHPEEMRWRMREKKTKARFT